MNEPILERDPSDPKRQEINPLLKLALELGPLLVFFFANARGEWLIERVPGARRSRRADLRRHRRCSWWRPRSRWPRPGCSLRTLADHAAGVRRRRVRVRRADALAAGRRLHQDEADHRQHAVRRRAARRPGLRPSLLGYVFDSAFHLDAEGWRKLTFRWGLFFLFLAVVNEVVWRIASRPTPGSRSRFGASCRSRWSSRFSQMPLIMRHSLDEQPQDRNRRCNS